LEVVKSERVNEKVAKKFLASLAEMDLDTYESLLAEDGVEGRPQIGERSNGRKTSWGTSATFQARFKSSGIVL